MRRVKGKDTAPEMTLRRALWRRGLRYRVHAADLPGKPDIVFRGDKVAVFVDGDFWHGNQWRLRGKASLADQMGTVHNTTYWTEKIERNMARDRRNDAALRRMGWKVIRIWESALKRSAARSAARVERALRGGRDDLP